MPTAAEAEAATETSTAAATATQLRGRSATKHLIARLLPKFLRAALPPSAELSISECFLYLWVGLSGTGTCGALSIDNRQIRNRLGRRSLEHVSSGRAAAALQVHLTLTHDLVIPVGQLHFPGARAPPNAIPLAHGTGLQPQHFQILSPNHSVAESLCDCLVFTIPIIFYSFFRVFMARFASNILGQGTMGASERPDTLSLSGTTAHSMFEFVRNQIQVRTRLVHVEPIRGSAADCAVLVGCCRGESLLRWCFSTEWWVATLEK